MDANDKELRKMALAKLKKPLDRAWEALETGEKWGGRVTGIRLPLLAILTHSKLK